jgi:hypothetical protein
VVDVGDYAEVPNFGLRHGGKIRAAGQRGCNRSFERPDYSLAQCPPRSQTRRTAPLPGCPAVGS